MISIAEFAIQIVISELSHWLKDKIGLSQPYKLVGMSKLSFYHQMLGTTLLVVLSPLVLLLVVFFSIHSFVSKMVDCPFCTAFWLALAVNHFYFNLDLIDSIMLAPLCLVFVAILDRIHFK